LASTSSCPPAGVWRRDLLQPVRFHPAGKFHVQVCRGTACHVKGSLSLLDTVKNELKLLPGQTSRDRIFSLEVVAVWGLAVCPGDVCERRVLRRMTPTRARKLLDGCRKEAVAVMTTMPKSLFAALDVRPRPILSSSSTCNPAVWPRTTSRKPFWPSFVAMWSASRSSTWAWEPVAWAQARPRWKRRFVSTWTPTTRTSRSSRLVASACAHSSPCWTFRCQASVVCHSCRFARQRRRHPRRRVRWQDPDREPGGAV